MDETRLELELPVNALRRRTDPARLPFQTTASLPAPTLLVAQARAREAMELALSIPGSRYNLYVTGLPGSGRTEATLALTREIAKSRKAKSDWVYVYNFERPEEPVALELPAGKGNAFARHVASYIMECRRELERAFTSEAYAKQRKDVISDPMARSARLLDVVNAEALKLGIVIEGSPSGMRFNVLAPAKEGAEQKELTQEEYDALPTAEQDRIIANEEHIKQLLVSVLRQVHQNEDEARSKLRKLEHEVADNAVRHRSELIAGAYANLPAVQSYLRALRLDVVTHALALLGGDSSDEENDSGGDSVAAGADSLPLNDDPRNQVSLGQLLRRYGVNVMVSHATDASAPVIVESNPTYANLMGRIDILGRQSSSFTDHMLLKPGSMHKAVGGFLIVQASDIANQRDAWEALSRMARFGQIELENGSQSQTSSPGLTIRPQPIRADVKVVVIGSLQLYNALADHDADFLQVFKVRADFDFDIPRDAVGEQIYAETAGDAVRTREYPALTNDAVAIIIEEGSRWAEDQERLSTQLDEVRDLGVEAGYFANKVNESSTRGVHVVEAVRARDRRVSMFADRQNALILQNEMMIATHGAAVGQINGLAVMELFGHSFGYPSRITATVAPGYSGVVDISRESELSASDHTKGVLTGEGFLSGLFAEEFPLRLSASLTMEQAYATLGGDSASSAELYAILSALSGVPIKQSLAVTGSVNQHGDVQVIGAVNHKIEGFFRVCERRGLSGEQGVIIPRANVRHLMLRDDVVEAVRAGRFHIYAVETIAQGIHLLTGVPFGSKMADGRYLEDTIAARVANRLRAFSETVRRYNAPWGDSGRP